MKKIICLISVLLSFLSLNSFAQKDEDKKDWVLDLKTSTLIPNYLGKVKVIRGKVIVGENELSKGDKIYPKGLIKTTEKSFVVIELIDETVLTLGPSTEFTFEKWAFRTKNDREAIYSLLVGKMRAEIKVKTKEADQVIIKSPSVAMGIRGTEVLLNHSLVNGKMVSQVALVEGKMVVLNKATDKKMDLVANDYVEVTGDKAVPEIERKLSPDEVKKYNAVTAPFEKNLMDYPLQSHSTSEHSSDSSDSEVMAKNGSSELAGQTNVNSKSETKSWKDNLQKLNDLRKK